ncbi:MAG: hypothetical protein RIG77_05950 [Cyclobacteriaceae bacterium]
MQNLLKKIPAPLKFYTTLSSFVVLFMFQSCNKDEPLIVEDSFEGSEIPKAILFEVKDWYDDRMNYYEDSDTSYHSRYIVWSASSINYIGQDEYWVLSVPLFDKSIISTKKKMQIVFYKTSLGLKGLIIEDVASKDSSTDENLINETNIYTIWGKFINSTQRPKSYIRNESTSNMRLNSGESGGGNCPSGIPPGTICLDEVVIIGSRWVNDVSYLWTVTPPSYYPEVSYTNAGVNHYQWFDGNTYVSGSGVNINAYNTNQNQVIEITEQMLISILEGTTADNTTNLLALITNVLTQYKKAYIKGSIIAKVISDRNGEFDLYLEVGKIDRIEKNDNEIKIIFQGKKLKFPVTDLLNVKLDQDNNFVITTLTSDLIYIDVNGVSSSIFDITAIKILSDGVYAQIAGIWTKVVSL